MGEASGLSFFEAAAEVLPAHLTNDKDELPSVMSSMAIQVRVSVSMKWLSSWL
jgi:hypothetical protein